MNGDPGPVLHRPLLVVLQVVQYQLNEHQIDHVDPEDVGVVGEDEHQQGVDWLPDKVKTSGAFTSTGSGGHHPVTSITEPFTTTTESPLLVLKTAELDAIAEPDCGEQWH